MKKLMIGLVGIVMCVSGFAQTVTVLFRGDQSQNYRVMIDGVRYRSSDAVNTTDVYNSSSDNFYRGVRRSLSINTLNPGTHRLEVYSVTGDNYDRRGQRVYTNNFTLRPEYNMYITINGNSINFRERANPLVNANGSYRTAMPPGNFDVLLQNIRNSRYQDSRATAIRTALGSTDYFTVDQVNQMLSLINSESTRLELAKLAYAVTADPANYRQWNALFTNPYYSNSLDEYVRVYVPSNGSPTVVTTGRALLSTYAYNRLLQDLNANNYQSGKYEIVRSAFANPNYAFTTEQIRQLLGAINSEPDRLYLAKQSYVTVSDPANFATLLSMFNLQANRAELNTYIINNGGVGSNALVYVNSRAPMSDSRFNELYRRASNHILPGDKYDDVRSIFTDTQNYFTSYQARQLMSLISSGGLFSTSESNRVELAKLAYSRITDTQNFDQVVSLFDRQSSRDELNGYVRMQANY